MTTTSATLDPVTAPPPTQGTALYWRLWGRTPRELGFLLLGYPIAVTGFAVEVALLATGAGTFITFFIGVFLVIAALYVARGFGTVEVIRLSWSGHPTIDTPDWQDARDRKGFWGWLRSVFGNGHYWLYLLHTLIINPIMALISWVTTVVWVSVVLGTLTYGAWMWALPKEGNRYLTELIFGTLPAGFARDTREILFEFAVGVVMLALLPFVTRGLTAAHWAFARLTLAPFRTDALQREVIALSASRGAAVAAEGQSLRKLERDLHDGPQQRLVRLQMDLAAAQRQLDADPERARALLDGALTQAKEALEELRALSRGFAPPLLLDRGLVPALESLAIRSAVPVTFVDELGAHTQLPQEIARNAYFIASELVTNVAKHADARSAELRVAVRHAAEPQATWLDLTVTDDGHGGASETPGHGLAGLEERLRGLGGTLDVSSPKGGPTAVAAHLPVTLG
ncbi:MAG: sensor domain-containing protein [Actinomycetota bacterium]